ncbi:MAG: TonB-dependent receptor plug domain-containing protein [Cyclobacteriaceae bacterium]
MSTSKGKWPLILLFMLMVPFCHAQQPGLESLRSILSQIEQQHDISFTFMDETVDSLLLYPPDEKIDLRSKLSYLEDAGGLQFTFINESFISVRSNQENSKLCGYLFDSESKDPIADALVYVEEKFTTTDDHGYFELSNMKDSVVAMVSHVGYKKTQVWFAQKKGECQNFYLTAVINPLDEILLQSYIIRGINKKSGGEIEMDLPQISILPGLTEPDVFFLLQNLPGISSLNETVSDINIRGGSNDQNLVLWNGARLYQTGHFFGLISAINPYTIEKASLTKNGTPAEFGEGVSGTIQVETSDDPGKELIVEAGSNLINADQLIQIPLRKTSITFASRQSLSGLVSTPTYQEYFDRAFRHSEVIDQVSSRVVNSDEQFDFYDFSVDVVHEFSDNTKIKAGSLIMENSISYQESAVVNSQLTSKVSRLNQGSSLGYFSFNHRWNDHLKTRLLGSISDYDQKSINFNVLTNQEHILENEVLETNFKILGDYHINDYWDISTGIQFIETGIRNFRDINTPEFRSLSKEVIRTTSLFTESKVNPSPNTEIVFGMRANYFDKIDRFRIEPRLSAIAQLGKSFSIELLGESKSQTAVQTVDFQTDFLGVEKRKWELINGDDIPLLTSNQGSLGLHYKRKSVLVSLEGFYKQVNGITTSSQGFVNQFEFVRSTGGYTASGLDFLFNPKFGNFSIWATYSLLRSSYSFADLIPPDFRSNFDIRHSSTLGMSYKMQNLELSSGASYRTGLPYTGYLGLDPDLEEIVYDTPNTLTLDPYIRVDFSAKYHIQFSEKLAAKIGASFWNLTNQKNLIGSFYRVESNEINQVDRLALGFTPNVNLRIIYRATR